MTLTRRTLLAAAQLAPFLRIRRPPMRVLLVVADDLGLDLIDDPNGVHPNIDAMRANGREYPVLWASSLCANARARIYTGLESHRAWNRLGGELADHPGWSLPTARLLPRYAETVVVGKWHMCDPLDYTHPLRAGCTGAWSMKNVQSYWHWERVVDGVPTTCTTYSTVQITEDAIGAVQDETPLVIAAYHAVHKPWHDPPAELVTLPPGGTLRQKALAMLEALDTCLGWLLAESERHGYTVLFFSDNGTDQLLGGGKGTLKDDGLRVPLYALGASVAQGSSPLLVQATDLFATVLGLLGAPGGTQDSVSFAPDLQGASQAGRQYIEADRWDGCGTPPPLPPAWERTVRDVRWHLIDDGGPLELYDLESDPGEIVNVANQYPRERDRLYAELPT